MGEVLLNGRVPLDWELPAIRDGRRREYDRDLELIAGLLPGPEDPGRPDAPRRVINVDPAPGWNG